MIGKPFDRNGLMAPRETSSSSSDKWNNSRHKKKKESDTPIINSGHKRITSHMGKEDFRSRPVVLQHMIWSVIQRGVLYKAFGLWRYRCAPVFYTVRYSTVGARRIDSTREFTTRGPLIDVLPLAD